MEGAPRDPAAPRHRDRTAENGSRGRPAACPWSEQTRRGWLRVVSASPISTCVDYNAPILGPAAPRDRGRRRKAFWRAYCAGALKPWGDLDRPAQDAASGRSKASAEPAGFAGRYCRANLNGNLVRHRRGLRRLYAGHAEARRPQGTGALAGASSSAIPGAGFVFAESAARQERPPGARRHRGAAADPHGAASARPIALDAARGGRFLPSPRRCRAPTWATASSISALMAGQTP